MSMLNRRVLLAAAGALAMAGPASADAAFGPRPGTPAPPLGALQDQTGRTRSLADLAGEKGVVLVFYRSSGWCPFCQVQLIAMNDGVAEFEKRGYKVAGISYDAPSVNAAFAARRKITYPLLSDLGSKTIDRWGLRDPQYPPGNLAHGVPRPIIFVMDRKGVVRASLAEESYRDRPPVAAVLAAIDALR